MKYVQWFDALRIKDVPQVGGKNASLGQMMSALSGKGVEIPHGFAVTADAYWYYLEYNNLTDKVRALCKKLKKNDIAGLKRIGAAIRKLIATAELPPDLAEEIEHFYHELSEKYNQKSCDVAVRSSATAEDLPTASFAGQQETFLNIRGSRALLLACKKSMASLFTDRAIIYRTEKGFDHLDVALSVGVQKMVRSDKAASGVAFSCDTETGFKNVVMIDAAWGLGESIVKGLVNPDEYFVFKPTLQKGLDALLQKKLGTKKTKIIYSASQKSPTKQVRVPAKDQNMFCLNDKQVLSLAKMVVAIEEYYTKLNKRWTPMDVEWAQDGNDGKIYIVQARPETIHAQADRSTYATYRLKTAKTKPKVLATGLSIGRQIVAGKARVIKSVKDIARVKKGEIIVTTMTDPDWVPVMKKAAGIITNLGGRTCHAAIVSRELNTAAIVGTKNATSAIKTGQEITMDCSQGTQGYVYQKAIPFSVKKIDCSRLKKAPVDILVNIADPDSAFTVSSLPVQGVGLARVEFIISNAIKIHPMALLEPKKITDAKTRKKIDELTRAYGKKSQFFVDTLAQGMATIAAAFYPRPVIVRLSDFKSNEYSDLIAGNYFEQEEANPMLGFRGASRYTHEQYAAAFKLECEAVKKVREKMGLLNLQVMVPFVRTVQEAQLVVQTLAKNGIKSGKHGLKLIMMCEVPSNVIMIDEFSNYFDGFSIGSNDLTQLTLGVDRDSAILAHMFDERDDAIMRMFSMAIKGAHKEKRTIGICGQAPSDYPKLADFLIKEKINSISLNPDSVLPFLMRFK